MTEMAAQSRDHTTEQVLKSKVPLVLTIMYVVGISIAIIANQRGVDPEGVILGADHPLATVGADSRATRRERLVWTLRLLRDNRAEAVRKAMPERRN